MHDLARGVASRYARLPEVAAVALAGSTTAGTGDRWSDLDLYVYASPDVPLSVRAAIAAELADEANVGETSWEPGEQWVDRETGVAVDVMHRTPDWIEARLDELLVEHRASIGYSTCFWWNVRTSAALFDRSGWFARLQERAGAPYPEPLRRAIVAKNHPLLREAPSSFLHQIELAIARGDALSVHHRTAALLASYFDVLFALNRVPHPGEKRLVQWAEQLCPHRPERLAEDVRAVLEHSSGDRVLGHIERLVDGLDAIIRAEGPVR